MGSKIRMEEVKELISLDERTRVGSLLMTLHKDSRPLGSLLLDPGEDKIIIDEFREFAKRLNRAFDEARRKEENSRRDVRKSRRNSNDD
jgi:hypothetical protein